ncbi:type I polyketide synthase [Streptomyces sp. O3]
MTGVAIVGLDCAFASADGVEAYWDLLMRGGDAIGPLPEQRRREPDFDGRVQGGFLSHADVFDHAFFAVSPRDAGAMDPQQRLLLQSAWRALEDSGRAPGAFAGSDTGVFVGTMCTEWAQLHLGGGGQARITPQLGSGSGTGMAANRISYHLNLKGPSLVVDTACSSSLVAVHLAVNSLLSGECGTALAAGANLVLNSAIARVYEQMGLAAPDGRCKPFSVEADGIVRSDGVGVAVLRRLEDALADGQRVYAVIEGTAVNQDGRSNGVTAPSRWSQQEVMAAAYRRAGVTPDQVRFVEAHGTGTVLGDIIECTALGEVHAVERAEPCAIGSVKGNLGHAEGAAGIAGLIKAALALHHRIVPASRYATRENPRLRLADRGLRLLKAPVRLPATPTYAGVSSFGMGGTNAHAVLGSAPRVRRTPAARGTAPGCGVFTVSADTPQALRRNLAAQAEAVARRPRGDAAALCWSSNRVKTGLPHRAAFAVGDTAELAAALRAAAADDGLATPVADRAWREPVLGFVFSGQEAHEPGTTAALYAASPLYRAHLDAADAALAPHLGGSVRELVLDGDGRARQADAALTRPALFAVQYALCETLGALGIRPHAVLGHGVGEYAAAVAAGVLTLADAARLIAARAVEGSAEVADRGADGGADRFADGISYGDPVVPVVSGRLGRLLDDEPMDAAYFRAHAREPVRFAAALDALVTGLAPTTLVEIGPRPHLLAPDADGDPADGVPLVHPAPGGDTGPRQLAEAVAALYRCGVDPEWDGLYPAGQRRHERLVPYAFATEHRFWRQPARTPVRGDDSGGDGGDGVEGSGETGQGGGLASGQSGGRDAVRVPGSPDGDAAEARDDDPVLAVVVEAVVAVGEYDPARVDRSTRFYEDLGFDSVMIMQLKDRIELRLPQASGVSVQQLLPELRSVGTLAQFLSEWISVGAAT